MNYCMCSPSSKNPYFSLRPASSFLPRSTIYFLIDACILYVPWFFAVKEQWRAFICLRFWMHTRMKAEPSINKFAWNTHLRPLALAQCILEFWLIYTWSQTYHLFISTWFRKAHAQFPPELWASFLPVPEQKRSTLCRDKLKYRSVDLDGVLLQFRSFSLSLIHD